MKDKAEPGTLTGTSQRVLHMLMLVADSDGPVSVREAAKKLGLPPSTSHRLLNLLLEDGFVSLPAGKCQLHRRSSVLSRRRKDHRQRQPRHDGSAHHHRVGAEA
jgi:DNA-binding IclR family transcriptional regulator